MNTPREILIAWASSEGFAAVHNGTATDGQIVDDLLKWLDAHGMAIVGPPDIQQSMAANVAEQARVNP